MAQSFSEKQISVVKRQLGNYPVVDAKKPFRFTVAEDTKKDAKRQDPRACVIAQAVKKFNGGIEAAAIFRYCSYIPMDRHGDGKLVIERFINPLPTKRAIDEFDKTGNFHPGEYYFLPPSKSSKLGSQSKYKKKMMKNKKLQQQIKGQRTDVSERTYTPKGKFLDRRNGTGQVSFTHRKID